MVTPTRIGIVGAGWIADFHADAWLSESSRARVVAVGDVDPAAASRLALRLDAPAFTEIDRMFATADLDAVDVCVPPEFHVPVVRAAARHGLHVLCEKPVARDLVEAGEIRSAVRDAGITYVPGHNSLFYPAVRKTRALLDGGGLGAPMYIRSWDCDADSAASRFQSVEGDLTPPPDDSSWRASTARLGGGALIDGGYHAVYRLLHLHPVPVASVSAVTRRFHRALPWEGEDTALVIVQFADGAIGEILISYAMDPPTIGADTLFAVALRDGTLAGSAAAVQFRPSSWDSSSEQRLTNVVGQAAWRASFAAQASHFLDVLDGQQPLQTIDDAIHVLQVVAAAYASAGAGRSVSIEDDRASEFVPRQPGS